MPQLIQPLLFLEEISKCFLARLNEMCSIYLLLQVIFLVKHQPMLRLTVLFFIFVKLNFFVGWLNILITKQFFEFIKLIAFKPRLLL